MITDINYYQSPKYGYFNDQYPIEHKLLNTTGLVLATGKNSDGEIVYLVFYKDLKHRNKSNYSNGFWMIYEGWFTLTNPPPAVKQTLITAYLEYKEVIELREVICSKNT